MGWKILCGDVRERLGELPDASVQCVVTSPPYFGLRNYGTEGQIGLETTPTEFVATLVDVFGQIRRVLKDDGTVWLNLGDSYARQAGDDSTKATDGGIKTGRTGRSKELFKSGNNVSPTGFKAKDLIGIPWRVAFALQDDGWYLRSDIIWHKPNPMPESVTDRPTKAHEYVFLLTKSPRYYYDADAIRLPYAESTIPRQYRGQQESEARDNGVPGQPPHSLHTQRPNTTEVYSGQAKKDYGPSLAQDPSETKRRVLESIRNGAGANCRTVWTIATQPYA